MTYSTPEELLAATDDEVRFTASSDDLFVSSLYSKFPEAAQHIGFDLFDPAWVRRYGRQIMRAIGHLQDIESWDWTENAVVGIAAGAIATDLLNYLGLPQSSSTAALALVVVIARGLSQAET